MNISTKFQLAELNKQQKIEVVGRFQMLNELIRNIEKVHTTELGVVRIKRNLSLDTDDVVEWCKSKIIGGDAIIERKGKNWYVTVDDSVITVNAYSFTIITAHRKKK